MAIRIVIYQNFKQAVIYKPNNPGATPCSCVDKVAKVGEENKSPTLTFANIQKKKKI
jgi:hypothetical protein